MNNLDVLYDILHSIHYVFLMLFVYGGRLFNTTRKTADDLYLLCKVVVVLILFVGVINEVILL